MGSNRVQTIIWAVLFFFGFTLLGGLISWLLHVITGVSWIRTGLPWEFANIFLVIPSVLLVVSYLAVRRLDHGMLSDLWLYAIVVSAIGFVSAPVMLRPTQRQLSDCGPLLSGWQASLWSSGLPEESRRCHFDTPCSSLP